MKTFLENLGIGSKFQMVGNQVTYRNLVLKHSNDSGCTISGERMTENGWVSLGANYVISCQTEVEQIMNEQAQEVKPVIPAAAGEVAREAPVVKTRKKRVSKAIVLPTSARFKVKDVIDLNEISQPHANGFINDLLAKGLIKTVQNEKTGLRGKPARIFELANITLEPAPVTIVESSIVEPVSQV